MNEKLKNKHLAKLRLEQCEAIAKSAFKSNTEVQKRIKIAEKNGFIIATAIQNSKEERVIGLYAISESDQKELKTTGDSSEPPPPLVAKCTVNSNTGEFRAEINNEI